MIGPALLRGRLRLSYGDLIVTATCVVIVALWTVRALRDGQNSDMGLAWLGGDLTWQTGRPDALFSWTGTPLLAAIMALVSRVMSATTSTTVLTLLNAALALGITGTVCRRLPAPISRRWRWVVAIGVVSFVPLMSTVGWKQINLIALALGLAGFDLLRRPSARRAGLAPALIGLSVAFKPLLILLPFVLLARRETRRAGLQAIGWLAALSLAALGFAAWRAHQLSVLNPWAAVQNFSQKSNPHLYGYVYSPDNFGVAGTLIRLGGLQHWRIDEVSAVVFVALLGAWCSESLRGRGVTSWDTFAFVAVFSAMISPIDWSHYQVMLAPLFVVLVIRMSSEGGSVGDWLGLGIAFVLASLVWRPYGTLPGTVHSLLGQGRLPPDDPGSGAAVSTESIAETAQYVLIVTGLLWYARRRPAAATIPDR